LTTHYIDEAENVDKVCIINEGKIAVSGSPDQMKKLSSKPDATLEDAYVDYLIRTGGQAA
jgi:ABC-2 type transport system ATP-binding protein